MPIHQPLTGDFEADLTSLLPKMRIYAMSLTHDPGRADDLVQQTAMRALAGRQSFRPGTNFPGWLFRIERNEFITGLRRHRPSVELTDAIANTVSHAPRQEDGIVMRDFKDAFRTLTAAQRQTLLLSALDGHGHRRIAVHFGVSTGTVKSRVSRARARLRQLLDGEVGAFAVRPPRGPAGRDAAVA
jgi:RNA polymerase sigma-70 factor (ECF subfamily)